MQLTVAFASTRHAREALRFLEGSSVRMTAQPRPVGHEGHDLALVDLKLLKRDRGRLEILLRGVHGLILDDEEATETWVG